MDERHDDGRAHARVLIRRQGRLEDMRVRHVDRGPNPISRLRQRLAKYYEEESDVALKPSVDELARRGIPHAAAKRVGEPAPVIVKAAHEGAFDLIAMGTPQEVLTPDVLSQLYGADMIVIQQEGMLLIGDVPSAFREEHPRAQHPQEVPAAHFGEQPPPHKHGDAAGHSHEDA